ncbi:glycosyltransferase [Ralstonia sp. TCR112]|uniref:glycosyltransferase family 2 protein n=1 Tax=Ralstonia sp. TCR112 TaxID=2601730 RepID=UPI0011BDDC0C|nr:glycosyltransferase [Ralstonia sp. TCR112]TXD56949.1 glycosyltransferase [Ralstonia sp. TCR112]
MYDTQASDSPLISVLLCAHNAEAHIAEAIESILHQSHLTLECIVVENGSTDRTWHVIQEVASTDSRVRAFQTSIAQLPFNLNYALMQARGAYVARMDADDVAHPERLQKQLEFLHAHADVAVVGSWFERFGAESGICKLPVTDLAIRRALPFRLALCHPTVMVRKEILLRARGYEGVRYCEDFDLWLRLMRDPSIRFANLAEPLLRYRVHQGQAKGRREGYYGTAGILLKEALAQRSIRLWIATAFSMMKGLLRGR